MISSRAHLAPRAPSTVILRTASCTRTPRLVCQTQQQVRHFRFGIWSSYMDPGFQKEVKHRHRTMKHKYVESINRRLSWDRNTPLYPKQIPHKKFMCSAWRSQAPKRGRLWESFEDLYLTSDRSEKSKRDAVKDVPESFLDGMLKARVGLDSKDFIRAWTQSWRDEVESDRAPHKPQSSSPVSHSPITAKRQAPHTDAQSELRYVIDPITNRKKFIMPNTENPETPRKPTEIPTKNSKTYVSQFQNLQPPSSIQEDPLRDLKQTSSIISKPDLLEQEILGRQEHQKDPVNKQLSSQQESTSSPELPEYLRKFEEANPYEKRRYRGPETKPVESSAPQEDHLYAYDEKVQFYKDGLAYDPSKCPIDYSDPVQKGLKAFDDKKSEMSREASRSESKASSEVSMAENLPEIASPTSELLFQLDPVAKAEPLEDLDLLKPSDIRAAYGIGKAASKETNEDDQQEGRLWGGQEKYVNASPISGELNITNPETTGSIEKVKITGNYVRDFPEEFKVTWVSNESTEGGLKQVSTPRLGIESAMSSSEKEFIEGLASKEHFSRNPDTPRIEPSLDRRSVHKAEKEHSELKEGASLSETSGEDLQKPIAPSTDEAKASNIRNYQVQEPTLYKILAYDPTMQSISTAETTSIVSDSSAPLTPAEVLLRLSNPAKFFPHFKPLQAQGYEIVSGSGDVLVFRKVRDAESIVSPIPKEEKTRWEDRMVRNPIDGMRARAPTGDFASPTGFVNYDLNRGSEPAFRSNIDVRREEPVFSGKRSWQDDSEIRPPKKGRGKRILVGAAWLAACSYAIGVVADFFVTGGIDGKGPQGF